MSNAYYALFHAAIAEAADDLVGRSHRPTPRYALAYRSAQHTSLRALCADIVKDTLPGKYSRYAPEQGFGADLKFFASTLVDLQDKRHLADYDPLFHVTKSDVDLAVRNARAALTHFRSANRALRKAFVSLVLFSPR